MKFTVLMVQRAGSHAHNPGAYREEIFGQELLAELQLMVGRRSERVQCMDLEELDKRVRSWQRQILEQRTQLDSFEVSNPDINLRQIQLTSSESSTQVPRSVHADQFQGYREMERMSASIASSRRPSRYNNSAFL